MTTSNSKPSENPAKPPVRLTIRFLGGSRAGEPLEFTDERKRIKLGRDASSCDVVFPDEETTVGGEHCTLVRATAGYQLEIPKEYAVFIGPNRVYDGYLISGDAELQLSSKGPKLRVRYHKNKSYTSTDNPDQPADGLRTLVGRALKRSKTAAAVAGVALLAAAAVGTYVILNKWITDRRIGELVQISNAELNTLDKMGVQLTGLVRDSQRRERFVAALEAARPSIYVVYVEKDGVNKPAATAWVVDREKGLLATNAHVAATFERPDDCERMTVRLPNPDAKPHAVQKVAIHPGYHEFSRHWDRYVPAQQDGSLQWHKVKSAGSACDVALLHVDDGKRLSPALKLADRAALEKLSPGVTVGYVGYPTEGVHLSEAPGAKMHMAYVVALTDFLGSSCDDPAERELVQHALPTAGGASGSPIFNEDGLVVAVHNAGSMIGESDEKHRISSGAAVNFAQRVDLLQELLSGTAADVQPNRTARWTADMPKSFRALGEIERTSWHRELVARWHASLAVSLDYDYGYETLIDLESKCCDLPDGARGCPADEVELSGAGEYLLLAAADRDGAVSFLFDYDGGSGTQLRYDRSNLGISDKPFPSWLCGRKFNSPAAAKAALQCKFTPLQSTPEGDVSIRRLLLRLKRTPASAEERLRRVVDQWSKELGEVSPQTIATQDLRITATADNSPSAAQTVSLPGDGKYLFVATVDSGYTVGMSVTLNEDRDTLQMHQAGGTTSYVRLRADAPAQATIRLIGGQADVTSRLQVFRIAADH